MPRRNIFDTDPYNPFTEGRQWTDDTSGMYTTPAPVFDPANKEGDEPSLRVSAGKGGGGPFSSSWFGSNQLDQINNPFSSRPFISPFSSSKGIGLTGLDPKFIQDPRFDYEAKMGMNPEESKYAPVVLMGNQQRDDYDSAPVGVKSILAVDTPWNRIAGDMEGKSTGPSDWFTQNARDIMGPSKTATQTMAEQMRQRMLNNRNRIEDRYNENNVPAGVPTVEQEALRQPAFDPIDIATGAFPGAGTTGSLIERLGQSGGWQGAFGAAMGIAGDEARGSGRVSEAPNVSAWFRPKDQSELLFKPPPDTRKLMHGMRGSLTSGFNEQEQKYYPGEGYPEYKSRLPMLHQPIDTPPDPKDLVYHALSTDVNSDPEEATNRALEKVKGIQDRGLSSGWFSEGLHRPFGPLHIGTIPPKDWNLKPRIHHMAVDPEIELSPTRSGSPIPPHDLWLIDHEGNLLGKLGDPTKASEWWQRQAQPNLPTFDEENEAKYAPSKASQAIKDYKSGKSAADVLKAYKQNPAKPFSSMIEAPEVKQVLSKYDDALAKIAEIFKKAPK